jgi:glycosyltransferase involved in cell wall biosynthesis
VRAGFVADRCAKAGVGLIHAHFANSPGTVAWFASRMSGIPFSFTAHAKDLYLTAPRSLCRRARDASFIATCTGHNVEYLRSILPERDHDKVHLAYHGVDLVRFGKRSAPPPAGNGVFILSVGRLVPKKGHDDLIDALAILAGKGVPFRCEIVGGGPLHDELQERIDRLGLSGQVTLVGAKAQVDLIEYYRRADIFALAPRVVANGDRDGIPNVLAEAMAIGVPVVGTAVSGIPELIRNGESGLLVEPNAPGEMAAALARLVEDPALRERLACGARAALERNFDCLKTTRELRRLMRACANGATQAQSGALFNPALAAPRAD